MFTNSVERYDNPAWCVHACDILLPEWLSHTVTRLSPDPKAKATYCSDSISWIRPGPRDCNDVRWKTWIQWIEKLFFFWIYLNMKLNNPLCGPQSRSLPYVASLCIHSYSWCILFERSSGFLDWDLLAEECHVEICRTCLNSCCREKRNVETNRFQWKPWATPHAGYTYCVILKILAFLPSFRREMLHMEIHHLEGKHMKIQ